MSCGHHRSWHKPSGSVTRGVFMAGREVSAPLPHVRQHGCRSGRASWLAALAVVAAVAVGATSAQQHDNRLRCGPALAIFAPLQVRYALAGPSCHHAAGHSAYPQLALPQGFLEVHSCGLHLHWPGGHLQLSPQAGHPMLSPATKEATPCHGGNHTTAKSLQ